MEEGLTAALPIVGYFVFFQVVYFDSAPFLGFNSLLNGACRKILTFQGPDWKISFNHKQPDRQGGQLNITGLTVGMGLYGILLLWLGPAIILIKVYCCHFYENFVLLLLMT